MVGMRKRGLAQTKPRRKHSSDGPATGMDSALETLFDKHIVDLEGQIGEASAADPYMAVSPAAKQLFDVFQLQFHIGWAAMITLPRMRGGLHLP